MLGQGRTAPGPSQPHPSKRDTSLTGQVSAGPVCPPHCSVALGFWLRLAVGSEDETALGPEERARGARPACARAQNAGGAPHPHPVPVQAQPVLGVQSGVKELDHSVPTPGALPGSERTLAAALGRLRGPLLPLAPPLSQVTPGPGERARAAPQVFQHLPPTEAVERGCGPPADSPQATQLTTTKTVSTCLTKARFTCFSSFVLRNSQHFSEDPMW